MAIPVMAMFISDFIIGFHPYQFVIYSTILKNHKYQFLQSTEKVVHHTNCAFNIIAHMFTDNIHIYIVNSILRPDIFGWECNLIVSTYSVKVKRTLYKSSPY